MGFESLREEESIAFFKNNSIAVPGRIATIRSQGGRKFPDGIKDHLRHEGVGKKDTVSDETDYYEPNSYNV